MYSLLAELTTLSKQLTLATYNNLFIFKNYSWLNLFFIQNKQNIKNLISPQLTFENILKSNRPLFSFFIRKIDKDVQKYSRGKSGKYFLVWKYITVQKSQNVIFHWLKRELKLEKSLSINLRVNKVFTTLIFYPEKSFTHKLKSFTHKFIFNTYRKNLKAL